MDRSGNIIYAVDFDGTLSRGRWPELGEPNEILFNFLIEKKKNGAAVKYCRDWGA